MSHNAKRQSGRTTKRMQGLPTGGTFIVHNQMMVDYCKKLSEKISRPDIKIYTTDFLRHNRWRGLKFTGIDVDHFCELTTEELRSLRHINWFIERNLPDDTSV